MSQPGDSSEGIEVPLGNPDTLRAGARQLEGVASQLEGSSGQIAGLPSLMSSWAGPGSSAFAGLTGQEAASVRSSSASVALAALNIDSGAGALEDAQRKAQRAIRRAERARDEIDAAREDIREAETAQETARGRMALAAIARDAAQQRLLASIVDAVAGDGSAALAVQAAEAEHREAEADLQDALRRESRARRRLAEAEEDMREARRDGREAADDAELAGLALQGMLINLPAGVLALPGAPARSHLAGATGIQRPQAPATGDVPISEREPPENWPWWAKSWFKVGRGTATALDGTYRLGRDAVEHPDRIPGAFYGFGERAYHDPLGTGKSLVGYDELAGGRYEDWLGQMGLAAFGGAAGAAPARAVRLNRVAGSPRLQPLGRMGAPRNSKFAGRRMDFGKTDFNAPAGSKAPEIAAATRQALAEKYPTGVRFTRAGYPVFTPYAVERVHVEQQGGTPDFDAANREAGFRRTPPGYTWHHVEDGRTMELVPSDLHRGAQHTGGGADPTGAREQAIKPGGVPTPGEQAAGRAGAGAGGATGAAGAQEGSE